MLMFTEDEIKNNVGSKKYVLFFVVVLLLFLLFNAVKSRRFIELKVGEEEVEKRNLPSREKDRDRVTEGELKRYRQIERERQRDKEGERSRWR